MAEAPTVILGAGIIGVATAYYLSEHQDPSTIHIVEAAPELFASASGYAGGFLARDWHPPATAALAVLSFDEHRRLAEEHGGRERWAYSATAAVGYDASREAGDRKRGDDWLRDGTSRADAAPDVAIGSNSTDGGNQSGNTSSTVPPWLRRREGDQIEVISEAGTTAQVDPLLLCRFLLGECVGRGVKVHHPARAVGVEKDEQGNLASLRLIRSATDGGEEDARESSKKGDVAVVPCARLIIAAGAWSGRVCREVFPEAKTEIPVESLAGHSIVLRSPRWYQELETQGCHTVFTTGEEFAPEIFARVGGGIYFAGLNSSAIPLPDVAGTVKPQGEAIRLLQKTAVDLIGSGSGGSDDLEVVREGLCFRPVTPWGLPIVSRVPDRVLGDGLSTTRSEYAGGVYIATGHGPWGISLALGTGKVLAEMVQGRKLSADVSALGLRDSDGGLLRE